MNEVLRTIEQRFSCRDYDGRPVDKETLQTIAKAALQSPSAMNLQPWRLLVIADKAMVDKLDCAAMDYMKSLPDKGLYNRIMERGGKVFYNAPVLYLILKDPAAGSNWTDVDCGIMTQNICLAAASLGLDSVIVAMAHLSFRGEDADELKAALKWPEGLEFGMGVLVGHGIIKKEPHEIDWGKVINY
ncbi:MAG: nitroreductase family protein [Clostridiales bacterium]|jgi:nitroreductase|nr:nitroreductase family protein [Clostridiales bacterium]